jgi:hypothetical protein
VTARRRGWRRRDVIVTGFIFIRFAISRTRRSANNTLGNSICIACPGIMMIRSPAPNPRTHWRNRSIFRFWADTWVVSNTCFMSPISLCRTSCPGVKVMYRRGSYRKSTHSHITSRITEVTRYPARVIWMCQPSTSWKIAVHHPWAANTTVTSRTNRIAAMAAIPRRWTLAPNTTTRTTTMNTIP